MPRPRHGFSPNPLSVSESACRRLLQAFLICWFLFDGSGPVSAEPITPYTGELAPYAANAARVPGLGRIVGGIASHHGLASQMIARFYDHLQASVGQIESVVLIGPDHFRSGRRNISACPSPWQIGGLLLDVDDAMLHPLRDAPFIGLETLPFRLEHSIGLHIHFIGHYFPNAKVLALMVKNTASERELSSLVSLLSRSLSDNVLLILSMDFSHYKPSREALREDEKSVAAILSFQTDALRGLDIDAPRALKVFLETLRQKDATKGFLLERTDSSKLLETGVPGVKLPDGTDLSEIICTSYASILFGR